MTFLHLLVNMARSDAAGSIYLPPLGLVGQLLDQMVPGQKPKLPMPKRDTGYRPIGLVERPLDWLMV